MTYVARPTAFGPTSGIYVESLTSGAGAAWNARATFPGASTLKLAIAVTALAHLEGAPGHGSYLDRLLRQMLVQSDNAAANAVERAFGGSTSGGSALVNALMRSLGLVDTEMYGGYETDGYGAGAVRLPAAAIPLRVESQPAWGYGKRTTARDLAGAAARRLARERAASGRFASAQPGFTPADARYLLYVLAQVGDHGQARPGGRRRGGGAGAAQGGLDRHRPSRQRHRLLAGRGVRGDGDDVPVGRRGNRLGRPRGPRRAHSARPLPRLTLTPPTRGWLPPGGARLRHPLASLRPLWSRARAIALFPRPTRPQRRVGGVRGRGVRWCTGFAGTGLQRNEGASADGGRPLPRNAVRALGARSRVRGGGRPPGGDEFGMPAPPLETRDRAGGL